MPALGVFPGHRTLALMGVLWGVGAAHCRATQLDAGSLAHCLVAFPRPSPGWEGKLWPLPACQVAMETPELEVLEPPHPAFCQAPVC